MPAVRAITSAVPFCPAAALLPRRWVRVFNGQMVDQGPQPMFEGADQDPLPVATISMESQAKVDFEADAIEP